MTDAHTIVGVELPAGEFAFEQALSELPTVRFDSGPVVADGTHHTMSSVWASGEDGGAIERALTDDPSVVDCRQIARSDNGWLYRIDWEASTVVPVVAEEGGTTLAASGSDGRWALSLQFPERRALSRTFETCRERGLSMEITRIDERDDQRFEHTDVRC
jgi:hypothetical protein